MAKKFLVFQHSPWEGPGKILREAALGNDVELDVIKTWQEKIPELDPYDCLLILGGGPNVDQEEKFPFLCQTASNIDPFQREALSCSWLMRNITFSLNPLWLGVKDFKKQCN